MLKFIRKYQLIILVVGGSLLMVVFLLQPILTKLGPSPLKAKIASLGDGSKITRGDIQNANVAISLLKRVNPRALGPRSTGGIGIDTTSETNTAIHWLLLVKQAEAAGLVGEAGDGASWIDELAQTEALIQLYTDRQRGLSLPPQEEQDRLDEYRLQVIEIMNRNASLSAGTAGGTMNDVYLILAQARGVYRLLSSIQTMPAFSDLNAIHAAHEALDSVAIDAAVLDSSLISSTIADPTDEQLQTFFDEYKGLKPIDNEYGIGYTQPTRIQIGWMTLDKQTFIDAVNVDRVELNKIWRQDRVEYPNDFAYERARLEDRFRDELATDMMIEADRIVRAQVLALTNGLTKVEGIHILPSDWESKRPRLEDIASAVVEKINEQFQVALPTPSITIIGDRWLNANGVVQLPDFGASSYRVGSRQLPAYSLPQFFELTEPNTTGLDVQVGLPLVDPPATDQFDNRYYAVILGLRAAGPADVVADIGRDIVVRDYKSVESYKVLAGRVEEFKAAIASNGTLVPAINLGVALSSDPQLAVVPGVMKNLLVRRDMVDRGNSASVSDPRLNTEAFRNAVIEASKDLAPLASPDEVASNPIPVVVALPRSKSVVIALIIAPRPVTLERFRTNASRVIATAAQRELVDAGFGDSDPFTMSALATRYGLTKVKDEEDSPAEDSSSDEG